MKNVQHLLLFFVYSIVGLYERNFPYEGGHFIAQLELELLPVKVVSIHKASNLFQ